MLSIVEIQKLLPHRHPFLFVERILELKPLKTAVGIKNVTMNEWPFIGHFPTNPVMPGVLILESMVQVGGLTMLRSENLGELAFLVGVDKVRFRKPVIPGDQLRIVTEVLQFHGTIGKIRARSFVNDEVVAEGEFSIVLSSK